MAKYDQIKKSMYYFYEKNKHLGKKCDRNIAVRIDHM